MPSRGQINRQRDIVDFCLSDRACRKDIPTKGWERHLSRYWALKIWLSYRAAKVLDRGLSVLEVA